MILRFAARKDRESTGKTYASDLFARSEQRPLAAAPPADGHQFSGILHKARMWYIILEMSRQAAAPRRERRSGSRKQQIELKNQ
jgi:hypothetical protein